MRIWIYIVDVSYYGKYKPCSIDRTVMSDRNIVFLLHVLWFYYNAMISCPKQLSADNYPFVCVIFVTLSTYS